MTKQEYMKQLTEKLSVFDEALAKEIIDDYEGHFREGNDNGKTEEEICAELGSIDEIIEELCQLYEPKKKEDNGFQSTVNEVVNDALHLANNFADTLVKGIKSGIDYGKRTWYEKTKDDVVDAECTKEKIINCRKVFIDAGCADVRVIEAEDDEFQLEYINRGSLKDKILYHFHGEQKGEVFSGRLVKEQGNSSLFQMLKAPEIEIIMKIPQNFESVEVITLSGDISIESIQARELHLTTASGDIAADNFQADKAVIESASGDATISNAKGSTLRLKMKSGDIMVNCCDFDDILCKSKSGDLGGEDNHVRKLTAELLSATAKLCKLTTDMACISNKSGDISLTSGMIKDLSMSTESGDIHLNDMEIGKLEATSESGDMQLKSQIGCYTLKSSSGDINLQSQGEMNGTVSSSSGSVDIEILEGEGGYTAEINTVSGDAVLQFANSSKHGMHKGIFTMGEGKSVLSVSNVSGDITIRA